MQATFLRTSTDRSESRCPALGICPKTIKLYAACSLAESGMLTHQQRLAAVPQLIKYSDDPALDAQTQGWAFQALIDITRQRLPNDSAVWRNWYQTSAASGQ